MRNVVNLTKTDGYQNLVSKISSSIDNIPDLNISDGHRVLIKPNLCNFRHPSSGAITHPEFLDAVLCVLRKKFDDLDITVIESDATASKPDITLKWFGFDKILEKWGAKWCNLSQNPTITRKIDGLFFDEIELPEIFDNCDYFISLPKLKTHSLTKFTASLKNQFGCMPIKNKSKFHKNIDEVIADINLAIKPDLCIVDGILSMCGGVAIYGTPIQSNIILVGKDPVSVDAVCAKLFGYNPRRIGCIKKSIKVGLGTDKYSLVGDVNNLNDVKIDNEISFLKAILLDLGRNIQRRVT
ncbi:MAG: DUF362 domain-containing protein [Halobacteriota archaeon]|nr:DUF362 domain-containing protein [Halobacteriota archaeon]